MVGLPDFGYSLPDIGQALYSVPDDCDTFASMSWQEPKKQGQYAQLIQRLMVMADLDEEQATSVIMEILDATSLDVDAFIQQRHEALQRQGYRGEEIYRLIQQELTQWRFAAPTLSIRQIRRRIYG